MTRADWVAAIARVVFGLCALGILLSAFLNQNLIRPLGAIGCVAAIAILAIVIGKATITQRVSWKKAPVGRRERPIVYWAMIAIYVLGLILYVLAALTLTDLI